MTSTQLKEREPLSGGVTVAAVLPPQDAATLAALAKAGDRTLSAEIRRAVRRHVAKETEGAD